MFALLNIWKSILKYFAHKFVYCQITREAGIVHFLISQVIKNIGESNLFGRDFQINNKKKRRTKLQQKNRNIRDFMRL